MQGDDEGKVQQSAGSTARKLDKTVDIVKIASKSKVGLAVVIVVAFFVVVIVAGGLKVLGLHKEKKVNEPKAQAIQMNYYASPSSASLSVVQNPDTVYITPVSGGYKFSYSEDDLEEARDVLSQETKIDFDSFNDYEVAVLYSIFLNDGSFDYYTEDELHMIPLFIKAEAATQLLDLRENRDKLDGNKNYVPLKIDDIRKDNIIPGVVLLKRTSSQDNRDNKGTYLDYVDEATFNSWLENPSEDNKNNAITHFTVDADEKVIIAHWNYSKVTVEGNYPDMYTGEKAEGNSGIYTLTPYPINIKEYVKKYKMPFELLLQFLIRFRDIEFAEEMIDTVLNSKIVINIQENTEEKVNILTQTFDCQKYIDKFVDWKIEPNIIGVHELIKNTTRPPSDVPCTSQDRTSEQVMVTTTDIVNTYHPEIVEVDCWYAHFIKTYGESKETPIGDSNTPVQLDNIEGELKGPDRVIYDTQASQTRINADVDVQKFKRNKQRANSVFVKPVITYAKWSSSEEMLSIKWKQGTTEFNKEYRYVNIPERITIEDKANKDIKFRFKLERDENGHIVTPSNIQQNGNIKYNIEDQNNFLPCAVTKLEIDTYSECDIINRTETISGTSYTQDTNPKTTIDEYSVNEQTGEYEKFCLALANSEIAQNQLGAISWLYGDMEQTEATIDYVDIVKYLVYRFSGKDYGVTELDLGLFEPADFISTFNRGIVVRKIDESTFLDRDDLENIISGRFTGDAKRNLESSIDDLLYIQKEYSVDPVFAIAVAQQESNCGTNWDAIDPSTHNMYSVKGSGGTWASYGSFAEATRAFGRLIAGKFYFGSGKYTIKDIGYTYYGSGDEETNKNAEKWIHNVTKFTIDMYESIGRSVIDTTGNSIQKKVAEVAMNSDEYSGVKKVRNRCMGWVLDVYMAAGVLPERPIVQSAGQAGYLWGVSDDLSNIPVGACVYGNGSGRFRSCWNLCW